MLKQWFFLLKKITLAVGLLLCFFALMEILRAYQTLHQTHWLLGYAFVFVLLASIGWLIWHIWINLAVLPRPLKPPVGFNLSAANVKELRKFLGYQNRLLARLGLNEHLSPQQREAIQLASRAIQYALAAPPDQAFLRQTIQDTQQKTVEPAIAALDQRADQHIRNAMRDVMIGVALSPYRSMDLLIVLYRNSMMTMDIIKIYHTRPAISELARMLMDILNVVATVNYIHLSKNLIEAFGSRLPAVGSFADEIAEGIGAGFMTTIAGHAAKSRCRAFHLWNAEQAKQQLSAHIGDFYNDLKDIFYKDIWGLLKNRVGQASDAIYSAVKESLDSFGSKLGSLARIPAQSSARSEPLDKNAPAAPVRQIAQSAKQWTQKTAGFLKKSASGLAEKIKHFKKNNRSE